MLWERRFADLVEFKRASGHTRVLAKRGPHLTLGSWVASQRRQGLQGKLSADQFRRLDQLGFDWSPKDTDWEAMLEELRSFRREHRHCLVPKRWPANPRLAAWVRSQRQAHRRGKLRRDRVLALEKIDFWSATTGGALRAFTAAELERWEQHFAQLVAFKEQFGHCRVPNKWPEAKTFGHWVHTLRSHKKKGRLTSERVQRLEAIGFEWQGKDRFHFSLNENWNAMFAKLERYRAEHGHTEVPQSVPRLGKWVVVQRIANRSGQIDPERRARLDALGFTWGTPLKDKRDRWERRYAQLLDFISRHGHTRVPNKWAEDSAFGRWVHTQRGARRMNQLSPDRIERLEAIGFEWQGDGHWRSDTLEKHWDRMFSLLDQYRQQHGHTEVPPSVPRLGKWVTAQRAAARCDQLRPDRRQRLESIGFAWRGTMKSARERWEHRFAQLLAYKERFGHCRVPNKWPEDISFGHWVHTQRAFKRKGTLAPESIARLDAIDFEWAG